MYTFFREEALEASPERVSFSVVRDDPGGAEGRGKGRGGRGRV